MEKINFSEFDVLGMITLQDVAGLKDFVSPISETEYLSRAPDYYGSKSFTELSNKREFLKRLLTNEPSKRNFDHTGLQCGHCGIDGLIFIAVDVAIGTIPTVQELGDGMCKFVDALVHRPAPVCVPIDFLPDKGSGLCKNIAHHAYGNNEHLVGWNLC